MIETNYVDLNDKFEKMLLPFEIKDKPALIKKLRAVIMG